LRRGFFYNTNREYTPDLVLQQYGRVKRSIAAGLSAQEVIANQTSDGVPVFGVVLPNKEAAVDYAFTVPMFKNELELTSPLTTNKVMDALGLPAQIREAFVARQAELVRYRRQLLISNPWLTK
jgi:pyrroline-5-carboxylate reductase